MSIKPDLSRRLREFVIELGGEVLEKQSILRTARIGIYFDDSIDFYENTDPLHETTNRHRDRPLHGGKHYGRGGGAG